MPWWKLPRDVLKPPEDRACEMLASEIALKTFEEENENYDIDPTLQAEYIKLKKQVEIDLLSFKNSHVDERCDFIYPNDWSSLYQRKVVILEKDFLISSTKRATFIDSVQYLFFVFLGLYILKSMFFII